MKDNKAYKKVFQDALKHVHGSVAKVLALHEKCLGHVEWQVSKLNHELQSLRREVSGREEEKEKMGKGGDARNRPSMRPSTGRP